MPNRKILQSRMLNSSLSQTRQTRAYLRLEDVCVGCVVWLPGKSRCRQVDSLGSASRALDTIPYHHPAVIVAIRSPSTPEQAEEVGVYFAQLTTFGGLDLANYASQKTWRPSSIPIVGAANPGNSPYLHFEGGKTLFKQSYVRLDNVYKTSIFNLRSYNNDHSIEVPAYNWRLDETSYIKLMSLLRLATEEYPSTRILTWARHIQDVNIAGLDSVPITGEELPKKTVRSDASNSLRTQDQQNTGVPTCDSGSTAAQKPWNAQNTAYTPDQEPIWAPQVRPSSIDATIRYYSDVIADPESQIPQTPLSSPYVTFGTTVQGSPSETYKNKRRECACYFLVISLVSLLLGCVGVLIWETFRR